MSFHLPSAHLASRTVPKIPRARLDWRYLLLLPIPLFWALLGHYRRHWDPNQERFFFGLLRECLEKGVVSEEMLREEMARNHVRHDALELVERTPPLAA